MEGNNCWIDHILYIFYFPGIQSRAFTPWVVQHKTTRLERHQRTPVEPNPSNISCTLIKISPQDGHVYLYCPGIDKDIAVICSDLSDKAPPRQVGVGRVLTWGTLGRVMITTVARNADSVGPNCSSPSGKYYLITLKKRGFGGFELVGCQWWLYSTGNRPNIRQAWGWKWSGFQQFPVF